MKLKKILFVAHSGSLAGGGERSLLDLVLDAHKRGYSVHVSVPSEGDFSHELKAHSIPYSLCPQEFSISRHNTTRSAEVNSIACADSLIGARDVLLNVKPDIVVINTIVIPWYGYLAKILGVPNIVMVREIHGNKNGFDLMPSSQDFFKHLSESANAITFNSQYSRDSYKGLLPTEESTIVYPVVSIPDAYTSKEMLKSHRILQKETISMIILGNIAEHKKQLEVLEALNYLVYKKKVVNLSLSIMGPSGRGPYAAKLHKYIEDHKLTAHVSFIPFSATPYENILDHDILLMASSHEAFGRVTLEGQLLERMVIGANKAGTLEIIEDEKTGLLYESGSHLDLAKKILWTIEHKEESRKIGQDARKSAHKTFSGEAIYRNFFTLLDNELTQASTPTYETNHLSYNPLFALIDRNKHVESKLHEYAASLHSAMKENELLQKGNFTGRLKWAYHKARSLAKRLAR